MQQTILISVGLIAKSPEVPGASLKRWPEFRRGVLASRAQVQQPVAASKPTPVLN
jgi:hypothetical protein